MGREEVFFLFIFVGLSAFTIHTDIAFVMGGRLLGNYVA